MRLDSAAGWRDPFNWTVPGLQWIVFLIVLFGDIGFDHPGKFGLDFDYFLVLGAVYAVLTLYGLAQIFGSKPWFVGVVVALDAILHVWIVLTFY